MALVVFISAICAVSLAQAFVVNSTLRFTK